MKQLQEAELKVMTFENNVIATSDCPDELGIKCDEPVEL